MISRLCLILLCCTLHNVSVDTLYFSQIPSLFIYKDYCRSMPSEMEWRGCRTRLGIDFINMDKCQRFISMSLITESDAASTNIDVYKRLRDPATRLDVSA